MLEPPIAPEVPAGMLVAPGVCVLPAASQQLYAVVAAALSAVVVGGRLVRLKSSL